MRYWVIGMCVGSLSFAGYCDDEVSSICANSNAYLQQSCQRLQQSADKFRHARDQAYQNEIAKNKAEMEKQMADEKKEATAGNATEPAQTPPDTNLPVWQKPLMLDTSQKETIAKDKQKGTQNKKDNAVLPSSSTTSQGADKQNAEKIPLLPPPGPTEFAPKPVTLPGGLNLVPSKPKAAVGDMFNGDANSNSNSTNTKSDTKGTGMVYY